MAATRSPRSLGVHLALALSIWLVVIATSLVGFYMVRNYQIVDRPVAQGSLNQLTIDREMALVETRQKEVRDLLTLLLIVGGFYTVLQGAFNAYAAQNFSKQAEAEIKRMQTLTDDIEKRMPQFSSINHAFEEAMETLARTLPRDWRERGYQQLDLHTRQSVFSIESFVGLEFRKDRTDLSKHFMNLGRFYRSKFSGDTPYSYDLDRAEYYLTLSLVGSDEVARVRSELGLLYVHFRGHANETLEERRARFEKAKDHFSHALNVSKCQRSYYNLAYAVDELGDHAQAVSLLQKALSLTVWDEDGAPPKPDEVNYNLACALVRRASDVRANSPGAEVPLLDQAAKHLSQTTPNLETLTKDLKADGELAPLVGAGKYSEIIESARRRAGVVPPGD
jgi:tetratricopeptide (TPR) repeat protein